MTVVYIKVLVHQHVMAVSDQRLAIEKTASKMPIMMPMVIESAEMNGLGISASRNEVIDMRLVKSAMARISMNAQFAKTDSHSSTDIVYLAPNAVKPVK